MFRLNRQHYKADQRRAVSAVHPSQKEQSVDGVEQRASPQARKAWTDDRRGKSCASENGTAQL